MGTKRPRCISCNRYLVVWGKTLNDKKRYGCHFCHKTRVYRYQRKKTDFFVLFRQYVLWGHTYEQLSDQSGYTIQHLHRNFQVFLETIPPTLPPIDQSNLTETFLLIDGLWLKRGFILMAYRQSKNLTILHISVVGREAATKIAKDLKVIKEQYVFTGVVSDGGTGIIRAVQDVYTHIPHQICLAHLHRDVINAIGRYPRDLRIKELKLLADHLWLIESKEALMWWRKQLSIWLSQNNNFLKERKHDEEWNYWYIHKGARRATSILENIHKTSFKFLDHPTMPKTTNEIEATFGHLGKRWLSHRGLKHERWEQFMRWFVYFYNKGKLSDRKAEKD